MKLLSEPKGRRKSDSPSLQGAPFLERLARLGHRFLIYDGNTPLHRVYSYIVVKPTSSIRPAVLLRMTYRMHYALGCLYIRDAAAK